MRNDLWRKLIIFGLITLFIGISIIPGITNGLEDNKTLVDRNFTDGFIVDWGSDTSAVQIVPSLNNDFTAISAGFTNSLGSKISPIDVYVDDDFNDLTPGWGYDHFDMIQDGIDAVAELGTVYVYSGNYYLELEYIIIDKPLKLVGQNKNDTIIRVHKQAPYVILIKSDNVLIENFKIKNAHFTNTSKPGNAAIYISRIVDNNQTAIIHINNNIIISNDNGIHIQSYLLDNTQINISSNEIYNNFMNGITISEGSATIWNNLIHNNNDSGIAIWGDNYCVIKKNNIDSNEDYGIWIDQASYTSISNNIICNTKNYDGIIFYNSEETNSYYYKNYVYNNTIENNRRSGIYLGYSVNNFIYDNSLISNTLTGIYIESSSSENTIYHNNFIENGGHLGIFVEKYCNAADNEGQKNNWDNGGVIYGDNDNNSKNGGGNYWSDYENIYDGKCSNTIWGYHGTWEKEYGLNKIILFKNFRIYLDFLQKGSKDRYPWCRQNGWNPSPPDNLLVYPDPASPPKTCNFSCQTNDLNGDKMFFEYKITYSITNQSTEWTRITDEPVESDCSVKTCIPLWASGLFYLEVMAYDAYENNGQYLDHHDESKLGFDGVTYTGKIPIIVS